MNIDNITIAQAREIAALFSSAAPHPLQAFVGLSVVVRAHMAGVWWGRVRSVTSEGAVTLEPGARRAWSWEGAGSVTGLRNTGPTGGRITTPEPGVLVLTPEAQILEVGACTPEADAAWASQPHWTGRE